MTCDPRFRALLGAAGVLLTAAAAGEPRAGSMETRVFRAVNGLPDGLHVPAWLLMQSGALGAVPVAAGLAFRSHHPDAALRMLIGGTAAWALAKGVKRAVRRPRPARLIARTRIRGREASG